MLAKGKAPKVPAASQEGAGCRHSRGEMGPQGVIQGIHYRFCSLIQRADGYGYSWDKIAF